MEKYDGVTVGDEEEAPKSLSGIVTSMMSTTQALGNAPTDVTDDLSTLGDRPHSQLSSPADLGQPPAPNTSSVHALPAHEHADKTADKADADVRQETGVVAEGGQRRGSLPPLTKLSRGMSATSCTTTTTIGTTGTAAGTTASPPGSPTGSALCPPSCWSDMHSAHFALHIGLEYFNHFAFV